MSSAAASDHKVNADRPLPVRYMPQLDALRAIAVIAVWFAHWRIQELPGFRWVPWDMMGVWLFFVLSGFLITGILLRARDELEAQGACIWPTARNFYARRFLRILPIYYLALFVMTALATYAHMPDMRRLFSYHLTYTSNIYYSRFGPKPASGAHFWSLSVEEQFYLVWPWVILLVPRRHLVKATIFAIVTGVASRGICKFADANKIAHLGDAAGMLMTSCLDLLAMGALLAMLDHAAVRTGVTRSVQRFCRACLWIGLPWLIGLLILLAIHGRRPSMHWLNLVFDPLAAALFFTWLIGKAASGFRGPVGAVLEIRPLLFLGRISYGLYVYHPFVAALIVSTLERTRWPLTDNIYARFAIFAAATITVSILSWRLVEKPLNGLKHRFKYVPGGLGKPSLAPPSVDPVGASNASALSSARQ